MTPITKEERELSAEWDGDYIRSNPASAIELRDAYEAALSSAEKRIEDLEVMLGKAINGPFSIADLARSQDLLARAALQPEESGE